MKKYDLARGRSTHNEDGIKERSNPYIHPSGSRQIDTKERRRRELLKTQNRSIFSIIKSIFSKKIMDCDASTADSNKKNCDNAFCFIKIVIFFTGTLVVFTGVIFNFFHAHKFLFHGFVLAENFTGTIYFSRAVFKKNSRGEGRFHGRKIKKFHGRLFFFTGKKKTLPIGNWPHV